MSRLLDTDTRYFDEEVPGIPTLINQWGAMINILDFCLVEGSPEKPVLSISTVDDTSYSNIYWISTIYLNKNHGFKKDLSVVEIAGSLEEAYNKCHRVQDVSENYITIAFDKLFYPEKPVDTLTDENITIKLAPLGYIKVFESSNKAVYRNSVLGDNPCFLRVDNDCPVGYDPTWGKFARVSIIDNMEYLDDYKYRSGRVKAPSTLEDYEEPEESTGVGLLGSYGSSKWYQRLDYNGSYLYENKIPANSGPAGWDLIGDNKTFYFFPAILDGSASTARQNMRASYCFGEYTDINSRSNINNHMLCCHYHKENVKVDFGYYSSNPSYIERANNFCRTNSLNGNFILNPENTATYLNSKSYNFSFETLSPPNSISGDSTVNFKTDPLNTILNLFPMYMKTDTKILKGVARGYYFLGNDIKEVEKYNITFNHRQVFKNFLNNSSTHFVLLSSSVGKSQNNVFSTRIAFKLNNWG